MEVSFPYLFISPSSYLIYGVAQGFTCLTLQHEIAGVHLCVSSNKYIALVTQNKCFLGKGSQGEGCWGAPVSLCSVPLPEAALGEGSKKWPLSSTVGCPSSILTTKQT